MKEFDKLLDIVKTLRSENGCSWDKKQTLTSIKNHILEEVYELLDAHENSDHHNIIEELGDILFHVVFQMQILSENSNNKFSIKDSLNAINDKLILRHPHIFKDNKENSEKEILYNWEEIKKKEKNRESVMDGIINSTPELIKANIIQNKASNVGFDYLNLKEVLNKLHEEIDELIIEIDKQKDIENREKIEDEIGDVLFTTVIISRFLNIDASNSLKKANQKFVKRFKLLEENMKKDKIEFKEVTREELKNYWIKSKETF